MTVKTGELKSITVLPLPPRPNTSLQNLNYRLRAGAVPWMGRVEVKRNGEWGTVCDIAWNLAGGSVLCRSLGYGTAKKVSYRGSFGRGVGPIQLTLVE